MRLTPWHGDATIAYLVPVHGTTPCAVNDVRRAVDLMVDQGYGTVITAALAPIDQAAFLAAGFEVHERLHLLARALPASPPPPARPGLQLRRARKTDADAVLAVDHRAFEPFWRLDHAGLGEAVAATPSARVQVALLGPPAAADEPGAVVGYSVMGRASRRGYVQRLAVDPDHHGSGVGRALLLDGLRWLDRRRVRRVLVNTQEHNAAALTLYEQEGFERQAGGLAVLTLPLLGPTSPPIPPEPPPRLP